jgi:hypothetical protein
MPFKLFDINNRKYFETKFIFYIVDIPSRPHLVLFKKSFFSLQQLFIYHIIFCNWLRYPYLLIYLNLHYKVKTLKMSYKYIVKISFIIWHIQENPIGAYLQIINKLGFKLKFKIKLQLYSTKEII